MNSGPNNYYPSMPPSVDPRLAQILEHMFDRLNYLLNKDSGAGGGGGSQPASGRNRSAPSVSIPAAADALLGGSALPSAGDTQFVGQSVPLAANGAGITITGSTNQGTVSVTNAATLRTAIGVAGVAAHTIPLAKLTPAGANGSITWDANGWITAYVDPT